VRFEIRYADGTRHTVEPPGHVLVVGRDPSCDLVVRDALVSRRHAVIETRPAGLSIRDTASANGTHLNGRRIGQAILAPGDEIGLGETLLVVVEGLSTGAAPRAPERLLDLPLRLPELEEGRRTHGPYPARSSLPGPQRPLTVSALATLSLCSVPVSLGAMGVLVLLRGRADWIAGLAAGAGLGLALLALILGSGLLARRPWGRVLGICVCVPAALSCVLTPLALVVASYLLSRQTRTFFVAPAPAPTPDLSSARREGAFTLALAGATLIALAATGLLLAFFWAPLTAALLGPVPHERAVLQRLRGMHAAQESFRRVCNVGYADLEALRNPSSVFPGYPSQGAAFLSQAAAAPEADGYRFSLAVQDVMLPEEDCRTLRRYRTYEYAASPTDGVGRSYLMTSDGGVHVALGRPASALDPVLEDPSRAGGTE
jgi:hypothetical protein